MSARKRPAAGTVEPLGPPPRPGQRTAVPAGLPAKGPSQQVGRWFHAEWDSAYFDQEITAVGQGRILEFQLVDEQGTSRGLAAIEVSRRYAASREGCLTDGDFIAAQSPTLREWLLGATIAARGPLLVHLCRTAAPCRFGIA